MAGFNFSTNAFRSLEFMDRAVRLRKLLNVTVLNETEVKHYKLLIVLFGNPFIDAMESKTKEKQIFMFSLILTFLAK